MIGSGPALRRAFSWLVREGRARPLRIGLVAGIILATAGCLEIGPMIDRAFPPRIAGLPAGQPWVALPIGGWVVEGGITADAIVACFDLACAPRAAVALFRARGPDADRLARILDDPAALGRGLSQEVARAPRAKARRAVPPARIEVAARREGDLSGFSVRLARPDGSREADALVLARRRPDEIRMVMIVTPDRAGADRLAREVAPNLD